MTAQPRPPWDPDPRYVHPPEPVHRDDDDDSGAVVVWIVAALVVEIVAVVVVLLMLAAPRSAPESTLPVDMSGQRSTPGPTGAPPKGSRAPWRGLTEAEDGAPSPASTAYDAAMPSAHRPLIEPALTVARGWATWYDDGAGFYGAVPSWGFGDDPYAVQVCLADRPTTCTHVVVRDFCACGDRHGTPTVIDLSPAAFAELAPLSRGVIRVTVEGPIAVPLPPTDGGD